MRKDREPIVQIDDAEFNRLHLLYKQRTDPHRRSPERVERPVLVKPSVAGGRIVNWAEYMDMVERGLAQFPPSRDK